MNEAEIKGLMSKCYKKGLKDGWDGKDTPTLKHLEETVDEIYNIAMMAKQEQIHEDLEYISSGGR